MKRLLFTVSFFICTVLCVSCGNQQKAKRLIRQEFKETLNDYKSYEPVSYSELSPVYMPDSEVRDLTPQEKLKSAQDDYNSWVKLVEEYKQEYGENSDRYKEGLKTLEYVKGLLDEAEKNAQAESSVKEKEKEIIGWTLTHKYRARVPAGGYKLFVNTFLFDENMTEVISVKDNTDD